MTDADEALQRVWPLSQPERLDELENAIEPVLDLLVDAGYAEVDGRRWRFTRAGVERAKASRPSKPTRPHGPTKTIAFRADSECSS